MKKYIVTLVAALFALSTAAFANEHEGNAGAAPDEHHEKKQDDHGKPAKKEKKMKKKKAH